MLSPARRLLKRFHPEGIPWPGTVFYNAISQSRIFQDHYDLIVKDIVRYCSEGSLLDIGTGPGWLLVKLHQACPGLDLMGLDVSAPMVAKARSNMSEAGLSSVIEVKEGNASHMPFSDNAFDVVVSTGTLHHWKEPKVGLNEVYRVLKPGCYGLMYDLVSDTPAAILRDTAHKFGRLKMVFLWLHAFEEPFYGYKHLGRLACSTLFREARTRFVGVMCCLILQKESDGCIDEPWGKKRRL